MPDIRDLFQISKLRRYLRIGLWCGNWLIRLLSATMELYLRRNFGCRYFFTLGIGLVFATLIAGPFVGVPLFHLFVLGLWAMMLRRVFVHFVHPKVGAPPHSLFAGNSWVLWQRLQVREKIVQEYFEPFICVIMGFAASPFDALLAPWLIAGGAALFMKQQMDNFKSFRRVLDALDAKLQAQRLNAQMNQYTQRTGGAAQRQHRARHVHPIQRRP